MGKINFKPGGTGDPKTFTEMLSYRGVLNNMLEHADGGYAKGMELISCSAQGVLDEILKERFDLFWRLIVNLSPFITIQFYYKIDPSCPEILEFHEGRKCDNEIFNRIHDEKIEKIKERIEKRELRRVRIFIFLYYKSVQPKKASVKALFRSRAFFRKSIEEIETEALNKLTHQADIFKRMLGNSEFKLVDMTEKDYATVIYQHLNPGRLLQNPHTPRLNNRPMRESLCLSGLLNEKDCIRFGDFYHKIIVLHELPERTYPDMISALLKLRTKDNKFFTNFDITTIISIPDQEKEKNKLKRERVKASGVASDGLKNDIEAGIQMDETSELLNKVSATLEKIVSVGIYVRFSAGTKEELKAIESGFVSAFTSMEGAVGRVEDYATLPIFLTTLPGYPVDISRRHKMTAINASHMLTLHQDLRGSRYPAVIFENNAQGLVGYGLNEEQDQDRKHVAILGPTGGGKSVNALYIVSSFMPFKPIVRIIDAAKIGGTSYEKFNFLVNYGSEKDRYLKTLLRVDPDSEICINMFDIDDLKASTLNNLATIIEAMVLEVDQTALPKIDRTHLEDDIRKLYTKVDKPTLSDFCGVCRDERIREILRVIWCRGGKYGNFLDGQSNVALDGPFLTFDLKNLGGSYPDLQRVMLLIIVNNIWKMVEKYEHEHKVVIIDEAWDLLSSTAGQSMLEGFYRTMRKANGVAISITQSLSDIIHTVSPRVKAGIFENIGTFFVCKSGESGSVEDTMSKELNLNSAEMNMIKNLERVPGEYNEVFMLQRGHFGKRSGVIRVALSPYELWSFTTNPDDKRQFEKYRKEYPNETVSEILSRLAKDYPKGANR